MQEADVMDSLMEMGTLGRHNEIITEIVGKLFGLVERRREIRIWHENYPLVYWGKRTELDTLFLVDINQIEDIKSFKENVMTVLRRVEPDFMMFDKNAYIENSDADKKRSRVAGFPDLIIEVWSEENTKADREFKKFLYATSPVTEHWYMELESNEVECYLGERVLPKQYLSDILRTQNGIEVDLRYMAIITREE
jgi:Uma2 family endonuclease